MNPRRREEPHTNAKPWKGFAPCLSIGSVLYLFSLSFEGQPAETLSPRELYWQR
jgi:hypothetical protein